VLVFTWDGVGLGEDGTLWGGEALFGRAGAWRRVASLRPFRLPGGDKAAREPWRSALGTCWETGAAPAPDLAPVPDADRDLLFQAWQKRLNAPLTSAAGRLFDAAAALTGVCRTATFEGQGPMLLEAVASPDVEPLMLPLERSEAGVWLADWRPLLAVLADGDAPVEYRAGLFHATLADVLTQQALHIRAEQGVETVGLAGGVFQNRLLTETAGRRLAAEGFEVVLNAQVPVNDGGLSFGQVIEFAASTFNE
jgi:hydrogenase maturation protein HypF